MGIFNEHSSNQRPFARGLQRGPPGVGFNLTSDGNYDMLGKKLTNVGIPTSKKDAATKKYVDDNSGGKTSLITVDSNIDMKSQYSITKLKTPTNNDDAANKKYVDDSKVDGSVFLKLDGTRAMTGDVNMNNKKIKNLSSPTANSDAANKKYVDDSKVDGSVFLKLDGTRPMTGNLNMNNKRIFNIPNPTGPQQPLPLSYGDLAYLHVDGSNMMTNNMNMNNKKIINLQAPTNNTDAATKKYVDDKSTNPQDLSPFLKKDGSDSMTGNLNMIGHKIINLEDPASDNDAANKKYVDDHLHQTQVQPSHYKDEFSYLMSSPSQWTDEIDNRNSFYPVNITDFSPSKGNFHDYNHKVLNTIIFKNFQGGYNFKMGLNFFRLVGGADYTLCLEILNTDYQLWHKTQISVDNNTSQGLKLDNVSVKKLQHRFSNSKGQTEFMYYHRIIINFKKLTTGNKFFLHILVNIPQDGSDLAIYPSRFVLYLIAYGIMSKVSNIDPDKVYDYHTAFVIQKTQVKYNVDINANQKAIRNIKLERGSNDSAATVGMVKELTPFTTFTTNYIYRQYFEDFYDFTDATKYKLVTGSSGAVFTGVNPNLGFQSTKDLSVISPEGLRNLNYAISLTKPQSSNFTICIVFQLWFNRNFTLQTQSSSGDGRLYLKFIKNIKKFHLERGVKDSEITLINSFNGKNIAIWLTGSGNTNIIKAAISNSPAKLTINTAIDFVNHNFEFKTEDGVIKKFMYSPNFYDFDSEQYHRVMLQEKINGTYIV